MFSGLLELQGEVSHVTDTVLRVVHDQVQWGWIWFCFCRWYVTQSIPLFFIGGLLIFVVVDAIRVSGVVQ